MADEKVRVRFAPSPTGNLHIGSARTALFNWLFARSKIGTFILRIEDTDFDRSADIYVEDIIEGLKWLSLVWDGEIHYQSKRLDTYKKYAEQILKEGSVYHCYCTDEELEEQRKKDLASGRPPKYDGRCRNLTPEQVEKFKKEGRKSAVRFKVPQEIIHVDDLIKGKVKFDCSLIGDFVIIKSNGTPAYNFAAAIDDHLMEITHVVRGEDHLSNTPKQILLYKALGFEPPLFAHLPMILGRDRTKLSKRHGATSVNEYRKEGFLPEAILNYLSLLGWSPGENKEIMPLEEIVGRFALDGIAKSPAVFDVEKLRWMNGHYLRAMSLDRLLKELLPFIKEAGYDVSKFNNDKLQQMVEAVKDNLNLLSDIKDHINVFFEENVDYESIKKALYHADTEKIVEVFREKLVSLKEYNRDSIHKMLDEIIKETSLKKGIAFKTIRLLLTGRPSGPELWRMILFFEKEKCLSRIESALKARKV